MFVIETMLVRLPRYIAVKGSREVFKRSVEIHERRCNAEANLKDNDLTLGKDIQHGDVVNFGDGHRFTHAYIACYRYLVPTKLKELYKMATPEGEGDKSVVLLHNRDDSGSGYLTIPECVTVDTGLMSDVITSFADIIKIAASMDVSLDSRDAYIRNRFGVEADNLPKCATFTLIIAFGELKFAEFYANKLRSDWDGDDPKKKKYNVLYVTPKVTVNQLNEWYGS